MENHASFAGHAVERTIVARCPLPESCGWRLAVGGGRLAATLRVTLRQLSELPWETVPGLGTGDYLVTRPSPWRLVWPSPSSHSRRGTAYLRVSPK